MTQQPNRVLAQVSNFLAPEYLHERLLYTTANLLELPSYS